MDFPGGRRSESLTSLTTSPLWSYIFLLFSILKFMVFPGGSDGKESSCQAGDLGLILGSGKSPGEGSGNPLQYSCLENLMDRGAAGYSPWGYKESDRTEHTHTHTRWTGRGGMAGGTNIQGQFGHRHSALGKRWLRISSVVILMDEDKACTDYSLGQRELMIL